MKYTTHSLCLIACSIGLFSFLTGGAVHPLQAQNLQSFSVVSGYVVHEETGEPISGANVFVANSLLGTPTDQNGFFRISGIPLGDFEIVASSIGFESASASFRHETSVVESLTLRLAPQVYRTEEIEVVGELSVEERAAKEARDKNRERQLETFRKYFLGVSPNADKCEILNPEVLEFEEPAEGVLRARAHDALLINNLALGYKLRFVLNEFESRDLNKDRAIKFSGKIGFEELTTDKRRMRRRWDKNRERAYKGSQRHFLAALVQNRLWDEGYMLLREGAANNDYSGVPGSRPGQRVEGVEPSDILTEGSLDFERELAFSGYLKVVNMRGIPNSEYMEFKDYVAGWKLRDDELQQVSWLALTDGPVVITQDGRVQDRYGLTKLGYWFFDRVAEMLPYEYLPPADQTSDRSPLNGLTPVAAFDKAMGYLQSEQPREGALLLDALFKVDPAYVDPVHGSVAFHLAQILDEMEQNSLARGIRKEGIKAMGEQGLFDLKLTDSFIRSTFQHQNVADYEVATKAYLDLLEKLDTPLESEDEERVRKHVRQMIFMLAKEDQDRVVSEEIMGYKQPLSLRENAGRELAMWWRKADPFPGTPVNDRLVEHLERVAFASENFALSNSLRGFDDRGMVYVRYGNPRVKSVIDNNLREAQLVLQQEAVPFPGPLVPPQNEFWAYQHIDEKLYFLFIMKGGQYEISSPEDLIPDDLVAAHKRAGRRQVVSDGRAQLNRVGDTYAKALIAAWRTIYNDLALHHTTFEDQVQELAMFDADFRATGGNTGPLNDPALVLGSGGGVSPTSYTSGLESRFSGMALQARVEREEEAVPEATSLLIGLEPLPVAVRTARFRQDDKETRTEVYWSHLPGTFALPRSLRQQVEAIAGEVPDRYLVEMVVNQHSSDYREQSSSRIQYVAADLERGQPALVQTLNLDQVYPQSSISIQWDQYRFTGNVDQGEVEAHERLKTGVQRIPLQATLSTEPGILEMSDLKPVYLDDTENIFEADARTAKTPGGAYPFMTITPTTNIGLYFEVYELAYGAEDQAQFTVEYEVARETGRRRDRKTTTATTRYTSPERTAREYLALDLSDFGENGSLVIRVTVTDETTGQSVQRNLQFNLSQ